MPTTILLIISLIMLNALFAAIEISLVSLSENKINLEIKKGVKKALKIKKLKEKPTNFLSVIQIMIHILTFIQGYMLKNNNLAWEMPIILIILSLVFGEITPKRIALIFPLTTAYYLLDIFNFIVILLSPIVWLLNQISNVIMYCLRIDPNQKNNIVPEEELKFLLTSSYNKGVIDSNESSMIQNIFDFNDTKVSDIMRHRKEIIAIKCDLTKEKLREFILKEKYTRFPVYDGNIDKVIGIIHVKDIFKALLEADTNIKPFNIQNFLRKVHYVTEFKNINELFQEMQSKQNHIAIVIDEYGGTAGIVTIEDVIEEILGEIKDEYDKQDQEINKISDKEFIIKGTTHLYEIEEHLKANLPVDNYDTLSGFMLDQFKRMPENNEKIQIIYNNWKFDGLKHNGLVITKIKVTKLDSALPKAK
ncbi:hemolysin family protein [Candidatus Phytoplasma melaleucae]|uniref:Hemolysin family protein n=1 Tax=Candidatus Phytoplasma melaleucae TaxID=2982630 RepID=A0ABT9DFE3_9MOLU|nr:hemolysin family protein ['Melaleuca sp.' phytoplasma]MDO8168086.1 hemolysin family protein ['Melaleuca sp.' phytoplasma]